MKCQKKIRGRQFSDDEGLDMDDMYHTKERNDEQLIDCVCMGYLAGVVYAYHHHHLRL